MAEKAFEQLENGINLYVKDPQSKSEKKTIIDIIIRFKKRHDGYYNQYSRVNNILVDDFGNHINDFGTVIDENGSIVDDTVFARFDEAVSNMHVENIIKNIKLMELKLAKLENSANEVNEVTVAILEKRRIANEITLREYCIYYNKLTSKMFQVHFGSFKKIRLY